MDKSRIRNDRLRQRRRARGLTQNALVDCVFAAAVRRGLPEPTGLDANYVSTWERGVNPSSYHAFLFCLAFDLPPTELGLAADIMPTHALANPATELGASRGNSPSPPDPSDPARLPELANGSDSTVEIIVNRREFLEQSIVLACGLSLAEWGTAIGILTDASHLDAVALADLRTATRLHMRQWCTAVPTDLLPQAMTRVRLMKGWLDRPHDAAAMRRDLQLTVAEAAINAGWLSNLADNRGDARALWMLAEQLAADAGDGPLVAIALAGRSCLHSPVDRGGSGVSLTVELLDAALRAAGDGASAQSRAYLHARRAEELAATGAWPA